MNETTAQADILFSNRERTSPAHEHKSPSPHTYLLPLSLPLSLSLSPPLPQAATLFPFLFFFGTSVIVSPKNQLPQQISIRSFIYCHLPLSIFHPHPHWILHPHPSIPPDPPSFPHIHILKEPPTRRQTLLQFIRLLGILQDERVEKSRAADFELDLVCFAISLDAAGWRHRWKEKSQQFPTSYMNFQYRPHRRFGCAQVERYGGSWGCGCECGLT